MIKYIVHSGEILASDSDIHWIGTQRLMELYGVNPQECILAIDEQSLRGFTQDFLDSLTHLYPSPSGNYNLEKA